MALPMETILVIDDDRDLCDLLEEYLKPEGFELETAFDGEKGIEKALAGKYSIVVLIDGPIRISAPAYALCNNITSAIISNCTTRNSCI